MKGGKYLAEVAPAPPVEPPAFPMHVVKISDVIEILRRSGPKIPCFEDLKAEGKLIQRKSDDDGRVIFFSHTWLGFREPDPDGVKMLLLRNLLQSLLEGKLQIMGYCHSESWQKGLTIKPATLQRDYADGFIWLGSALDRRTLPPSPVSSLS